MQEEGGGRLVGSNKLVELKKKKKKRTFLLNENIVFVCRPVWEVHSVFFCFFLLNTVFYQRKLNDVTAICHHYHQCSHWSFWLSWSSDCIIWQGGLDWRAGCWLVRVWSVLLPWNCCSDDSDGRLKPLSSFTVFFLGIMLVSLEPSWLSVLFFMILIFFFYHHISVF